MIEEKRCGSCGRQVSFMSRAGQRCPHCGVYWSYERTIFQKFFDWMQSSSSGRSGQPGCTLRAAAICGLVLLIAAGAIIYYIEGNAVDAPQAPAPTIEEPSTPLAGGEDDAAADETGDGSEASSEQTIDGNAEPSTEHLADKALAPHSSGADTAVAPPPAVPESNAGLRPKRPTREAGTAPGPRPTPVGITASEQDDPAPPEPPLQPDAIIDQLPAGDASLLGAMPPRLWRDVTGRYSTQAGLRTFKVTDAQENGRPKVTQKMLVWQNTRAGDTGVTLVRQGGSEVPISLDKLSKEDRAYVRALQRREGFILLRK